MKPGNIILLAIVLVALCQCKETPEKQVYSNEDIVISNAQAALYFHTVFREAENAWAFIDSVEYVSGTYTINREGSTAYKKLTYNTDSKNVIIEYHTWISDAMRLDGTVTVTFDIYSYRSSEEKIANVQLTDFSINDQTIAGSSSIKYDSVENSDNDHYIYNLLKGAAIYESGINMPVLITGAIAGGLYERIEGSGTPPQNDDVWKYSGIMEGILYDNPEWNYKNTVLPSYTENGESRDIAVHYRMNCATGRRQGLAQITVSGQTDNITVEYNCSGINFTSDAQVE